ncbi:MAG: LolA family protein [Terriglobales bacterium]
MKRATGLLSLVALGFLALCLVALLGARSAPAAAWTLPEVLGALTRAAPGIHSVSADATVTDYTALIAQAAKSSGHLYFERERKGPRYVLDLTTPTDSAKKLLYTGHTAYVYTPSAHQVIRYKLGAKPGDVNAYLLLGMGATGADLTHSFEVSLDPATTLDGQAAVELTLRPRSRSLADKLTRLDLWYDPKTWIGMQQKIWQPGGDYHLLRLTHIEVNAKLPSGVFSTSFPGASVVTPQM